MTDVTNSSISALKPVAQTACNLFMDKCKAAGLNVRITETYRSQARQNYLYQQGRTRPGNIVTWTTSSNHTSGLAWDICKNAKGQEYSDSGFFKSCGNIAAELGITWGGTWKTPDTPHFEVTSNWTSPKIKEDEEMTSEERAKFNALVEVVEGQTKKIDELTKATMQYDYIDDNMPEWAQKVVKAGIGAGVVKGAEHDGYGNITRLGLTMQDIKAIAYILRMQGYDV